MSATLLVTFAAIAGSPTASERGVGEQRGEPRHRAGQARPEARDEQQQEGPHRTTLAQRGVGRRCTRSGRLDPEHGARPASRANDSGSVSGTTPESSMIFAPLGMRSGQARRIGSAAPGSSSARWTVSTRLPMASVARPFAARTLRGHSAVG